MCRRSTLSSSELGWPEEANPPKAQGQTRWYTSGGDGWSTSGDHGWYRSGDHGWYTQADYAWSSIGRLVTYKNREVHPSKSLPLSPLVRRRTIDPGNSSKEHYGTAFLARVGHRSVGHSEA